MITIAIGGGVWDEFTGMLEILHSTIIDNSAESGFSGLGGAGSVPGADGLQGTTDAGGLFLGIGSTACATLDTQITLNMADINPDIDGILGVC